MDETVERKRIAHLLRACDLRMGLRWGFSICAREFWGDSGMGHLDAITPNERVGFSRAMLEAAATEELFWQGTAAQCTLSLPHCVREMGLWHMLPSVDVALSATIDGRPFSVVAQVPWEIAIHTPVVILCRRPVPSWPR